jgi:hypothetical protein
MGFIAFVGQRRWGENQNQTSHHQEATEVSHELILGQSVLICVTAYEH